MEERNGPDYLSLTMPFPAYQEECLRLHPPNDHHLCHSRYKLGVEVWADDLKIPTSCSVALKLIHLSFPDPGSCTSAGLSLLVILFHIFPFKIRSWLYCIYADHYITSKSLASSSLHDMITSDLWLGALSCVKAIFFLKISPNVSWEIVSPYFPVADQE